MLDFGALAASLKDALIAWGPPGLFLVAVCDSTFITLPEVNDIIVMTLSAENPARMGTFAALAALGSTFGSLVLYSIGRTGGVRLLRRRFTDARIAWARQWSERHGALALFVVSLLPPPAPFKLSVLSSGAFGLPPGRFVAAIAVGRFVRYFAGGFAAVHYGPAAFDLVRRNAQQAGIVVVALVAMTVLVYIFFRRRAQGISIRAFMARLGRFGPLRFFRRSWEV